MAGKVSLREKHTAATRQRIIEVAFGLFIEQGIEATTVDEIAAWADVAPRTFFRYFPTKEALLFHDFEERLSRIRDWIEERPSTEGPADTLVAVLCRMVDETQRDPEQRALMVRLITERPASRAYQRTALVEHTERQVVARLAERAGLVPDDLGVRAAVAAVTACFDIALRDWIAGDDGVPFERVFRATIAACHERFPTL